MLNDQQQQHAGSYFGDASLLSDELAAVVTPRIASVAPPVQYQTSWEPAMAERIMCLAQQEKSSAPTQKRPLLVGLVGIPGSGKSVSSVLLASELEKLNGDGHVMIMPHDGYHYPLSQLRAMPHADDLVYRRGAPDTFDAAALCRDLNRIRNNWTEAFISLPGFDHARGDPEPDQHVFDRSRHDIVICEGLYLLHDADGWGGIAAERLLDLTIFIEADVDACIDRLKIRNQCIPGYTAAEIAVRCDQVDRSNAELVVQGRPRAQYVVPSIVAAGIATSSST